MSGGEERLENDELNEFPNGGVEGEGDGPL